MPATNLDIAAAAREAGRWLKRHWAHFVIAPPMLIMFTIVHESAHALAAIAQGGDIVEFVFLPTDGKWGYVSYNFPNGPPASRALISLAPYLMWGTFMAAVVAASTRRAKYPLWAASTMYLWGFVGAFGDIANAWIGWAVFKSQRNDWAHTFGPSTSSVDQLGLIGAGVAMMVGGYFVQKRLYRDAPLSPLAYAMLVALLLAGGASLLVIV